MFRFKIFLTDTVSLKLHNKYLAIMTNDTLIVNSANYSASSFARMRLDIKFMNSTILRLQRLL
jgi:hypothetical protein